MIVARIAYDELLQTNPSVLRKVEKELNIFKDFSNSDDHIFVESAIWMDDIKELGWELFNPMHFVDTPYISQDYDGGVYIEPMNLTWSLGKVIETLNSPRITGYQSHAPLSFSWHFLIHLVGDLHQPLHT